jgi:uncharacterized lipoprotein YddW (UPF0748 family)
MRLFLLFLLIPAAAAAQLPEELRGVKVTNVDSQVLFSDAAIAEAMAFLADAGFNAVLPVVQNGGYTIYPSEVMERRFGTRIHPNPAFAGRDPLAVLIREAHKHGMEVYPWFEYGFAANYSGLSGPATGGFILRQHPEWAARDGSGAICKKNGFDWMNGIHEEVQDFMIELVMEVARKYEVDGIEFSDRMPAMPVECGYDDYTKALYKRFNAVDPPADPQNQTWKQWRANELTWFYRRVRDSVKTHDPALFVASSPNIYPWGLNEYLQDARAWVNQGLVDHWVPQLYRYNRTDYVFELNAAWNQPLDGTGRARLIAGILLNVGSYTASPTYLREMMDANRSRGVKGEAFFFYEGLRRNGDEVARLLKTDYYRVPATIPGRNGEVRYPTSVDRHPEERSDEGPALISAYPNPFNPRTVVSFHLSGDRGGSPVQSPVRLSVFDLLGREVAVLADAVMAPGSHSATFDAMDLPSGVYVVVLRAGAATDRRLVTLVK